MKIIKKILLLIVCIVVILFIIAAVSGKKQGAPSATTSASSAPKKADAASNIAAARAPKVGTCTAYAGNPLLSNGSLFAGSNWNDPSVIKEGSQYVMYASASKNFDWNIKIYRMVSNNGTHWSLSPETAVFEKPADPNAWDGKSTETPNVLKFNGTYYLFDMAYHTAFNDVSDYKIGYATSQDGIHWTRIQDPLIVPTDPHGTLNGDFRQLTVGEPGAAVFNNKIYLYFSALGFDKALGTGLGTIGLITSSDGVHWSAPQQVLKPDQSLFSVQDAWVGYSTPDPLVKDGKMYLFYDVAGKHPDWQEEKLAYAVSSNGVSDWTQHPAIFSRTDFGWSANRIGSPAPLLDGSNIKLYFTGNAHNDLGLGLATCNI